MLKNINQPENICADDRWSELKVMQWRFLETREVGISGIFVLHKYENELDLVTNDISFNSVRPLTNLDLYSKIILLGTIYNLLLPVVAGR